LVIGLGSPAGPGQPGLARHGTYGWPIVPGQALKGLTAAWASRVGAEPREVQRILGLPRPSAAPPAGAGGANGSAGTVRFLDALPTQEPSTVTTDVIVSHLKPYYDGGRTPVPPAEYNQPVPMAFLAVARARFAIDLIGRDTRDTSLAAEWCTAALAEEGAGAKTAAGYGVVTATLADPGERFP
jgi:CRISPR-associated protein Cmr6